MKQYLLLFTTMTCMSLLLVGCSQSALALGSEGHSKPVIATKEKKRPKKLHWTGVLW